MKRKPEEEKAMTFKGETQKIHYLKVDHQFFDAIATGVKPFEIRKNDRVFSVGDTLLLKETRFTGEEMKEGKQLKYTGRKVALLVKSVYGKTQYGLQRGFVAMGVKVIELDGAKLVK